MYKILLNSLETSKKKPVWKQTKIKKINDSKIYIRDISWQCEPNLRLHCGTLILLERQRYSMQPQSQSVYKLERGSKYIINFFSTNPQQRTRPLQYWLLPPLLPSLLPFPSPVLSWLIVLLPSLSISNKCPSAQIKPSFFHYFRSTFWSRKLRHHLWVLGKYDIHFLLVFDCNN